MVEFTNLPKEVVSNLLCPYLRFNDLLRLRRLCQWTKPLAEDYLRLKASTQRCIKVSLNPRKWNNLPSFLNLSITVPLCNIWIDNKRDGDQLWDMETHASRFLTLYGQKITQLRLHHLKIPMGVEALAFFESLPNLVHLEIDKLLLNVKNEQIDEMELPSSFRKLKKLSIEECMWESGVHSNAHKRQVFVKLLEWCQPCLESFKHANYFTVENERDPNPPAEIFEPVRTTLIQVGNPVLKVYDLHFWDNYAHDDDDAVAGMGFYHLLKACYENDMKLWNVNVGLIRTMFRLDESTFDFMDWEMLVSDVVVSLYFLSMDCFYMELPHLEAIEIDGTDQCDFADQGSYRMNTRKQWPNLKRLRIIVNSAEMIICGTATAQLLDHFFVDVQREKMEDLELVVWQSEDKDIVVPFPKAIDIGKSCPNLKQLYLGPWPESNLAISKLWGMLPLLEVLQFRYTEREICELSMEAFIGDNRQQPSFLKLTNLQSLQLTGLDLMPKITNELFVLVLRHMPLKKLYLLASADEHNNPKLVPQISEAGIRSLLYGVFAESIEKFPLKGWLKLRNVSEKKLFALEKRFRSSKIL